MASDRNDANDHPRSLHGANVPVVTVSNHFPTDREFVSTQINPKELTFQPLTDHSLQPTRQTGFMNLREKLLHIFQEEAERECRENPKYKTLTLKGRLSLTVNDTQKIFIDIFDLYPHQNDVTKNSSEQFSPSAQLDSQTDQSKGTVEKIPVDPGLDSSLIERVTSLGQIELIRRYNTNQTGDEEHSQSNLFQPSEPASATKLSEAETREVEAITPQSSLINQEHGERSTTGDKTVSSNQQRDCTNTDTTISDFNDDGKAKNLEGEQSQCFVPEVTNPDLLICYLCKDVMPDRMTFLLHVEKHCQNLAEKCQEDNSPNTLYHYLKDSGISVAEIIKPEIEEPASETAKTTKKPAKPPRPTKTKTKSVPILYIEDEDVEDDFEGNAIDSYSDDEKNDPSFIEEAVRTPTKRKSGPSTRSRAKAGTPKGNSKKSNIQDLSQEISDVIEQISPEDIPDLPLPKNMKHTNTGLAPFIARPVKKKTTLKKIGSKPTPKMSLKIRMKEKAKALAIKTANQVKEIVDLECRKCQKKFTNRKAYFRHTRRHDIKKCVCDICGKEFSTLDSLSHHQRGLHNAIKPYSCEECGKSFNFHHSYKLHKQKHSGSRPYKCDHCGKSYLTSSHLKAHQTAVHSQLKKDKFICSICGKAFNYQNSLKTHLMIHSGERPYKCEVCQKGFVSRQALRTHETSYHVTSKNFKCDVCNKFYKSEMLLNVHKRRHTTDVSRFMCDICGRQFMFKSNLESHKYVHQEGRPFSCDTCGKSFKCMSSLYTHQYTHKQDTPFKCKICSKGFKTKNCCKAHERRHSAEKSFICSTCGSCFPDKGGLSKHVRTIHNPQKHFVCKLCNKVGTRADNMRTHVKSHGKDIGQDNIENFIVEVLNADGMQVIEQVTKITPNKVKPGAGQFQTPEPQPASTINYSQMEMYQPTSTIQNHGASSVHQEDQHHVLQHYSPHGHTMLNHHNIQQNHPGASHPGASHPGTPPITQSNSSMTPPITQPPTPQIPQSMSPPVMQVNPSTAYTTLHPLTTEALVMSGLTSQYPPLYTPYKQQ